MKINSPFSRWWQPKSDVEAQRRLDEQLDNSFPASDPPSFTPGVWQAPRRRKSVEAIRNLQAAAT